MPPKAVAKIGLTVVVLVGALCGLLFATLREGTEYYKHVEEVMAQPGAWYGKRLQLHGFVVKDSILRRRDTLDYQFQIESKGAVVTASYTGVVPDTFKSGSEVVLKGAAPGFTVDPDGVAKSVEIRASDGSKIRSKCPSKLTTPKADTLFGNLNG